MSKTLVHIGDQLITLEFSDLQDDFDVDEILKTDYSNIYAEAITIDVIVNQIGQIRAEAEEAMNNAELKAQFEEAELKKRWRREANNSNGKFTIKEGNKEYAIKLTEDSIKDCVRSDEGIRVLNNNYIKAKKDYEKINSFYWSVQKKANKLENWTQKVTPAEFLNEIVEEKVNGILIKKKKSITKM